MNRMNKTPAALAALTLCLLGSAHAADASSSDVTERLAQQMTVMQQQLDAMRQELARVKAQNDALIAQQQAAQAKAAAAPAPASAPVAVAATPTPTPAPAPVSGISPNLGIWGYGELYYTHPTKDKSQTEADLARAVFGIGYHFDEHTSFNSEFEVEHAVASASDAGEFEVEQFYIDHQITDNISTKAGLFLMPVGLLNEHHEPTNYYGVQRNFVETLIIPSTWREGGVGLHGTSDIGLTWDAGVTTGLNLGGWNNSPEDPQYRTALDMEDNDIAPMQAMHQELQLANAQHLATYAGLNYNGVPGLQLGAFAFTGNLALPVVPANLPQSRLTLWETHARWTPGNADITAVYARGTISKTVTYNEDNAGVSNPIPSSFLGYYVQGAYKVWEDGGRKLSPFVRWEHYDMGASYAGLAPGFTATPTGLASDGKPWPQPHDRVWTLGANYYLNPNVVVKADYQRFSTNTDLTRVDLGLGLAF